MKKIFWTTFFWILVVFVFWSYVRLFNAPLGTQVGQRFGVSCPLCLSTSGVATPQLSGLEQQLTSIQTQLQDITQKMAATSSSPSSASPSFVTSSSTKV